MKNNHDTIAIITCVLLFAASSIGLAQTGNDYVSTSELYEGRADIVAGVRVALEPGFHATDGSMVHAFIGTDNVPPSNGYTPVGGDLVTVGDNPSSNRNYIKTTFLRGATTAESQIEQTARTVEVEYLNAFGNPEMTVLVKGSPDQKDLVSNILKYGIGGRVDSQYLPCEVEDDDGRYQNDIHDRVNSFYGNGLLEGKDADSRPFRQYLYDNSPLSRDAGYIGEGSHWATHPTHIGYKCNTSAVSHWKADATGACSAVSYPAGSLRYEERADEDGRLHRVYTDNLDRKVREEAVGDNGGVLRTAYVYDDLGRLRCVVPPKAASPDDAGLCYHYTYDAKGRIVEKTVPDHGTECCVYDRRNRMVMSQDGNLLANGEWAFSLYDVYGRTVAGGYLGSTLDRAQLQALFDAQNTVDEQWTSNGSLYGYSGASFPATLNVTADDIQNANWYDQYGFLGMFQQDYSCPDYPSGETVAYDTRTKGLPTGSLDKANLPTGDTEMLHVSYYDAKGRPLCFVNDNHLDGRTDRFFRYNFCGEVTEESAVHTVGGQDAIVTRSRYTYDHTGRKLQELYKVNEAPEFVARAYEYNAVGDLLNTYLYSPDGGNTFAQKLKHRYNIRGWLKGLNDFEDPGFDLFALRLAYEAPNANLTVPARYNGNISQMCSNGRYATPFGFGFTYDGYDRLVGSQYAEGVGLQQNGDAYTEDYGYDANGNLQFLWRVNDGDYIDELYYDYYQGTNRIANIEDEATTAGGYNAHLHPYNYDYNGNPTYDPSRHATIAYSRLNKPLTVGFSPNDRIRYSYTSTGTKLRKEVEASATPQNLTTDYCGEFMYEDNELVCIFAPFGRMRPMKTDQGTQWRAYYSLTDHLGNVRAEFAAHDSGQPELVQQADYYPFGFTLRRDDYGSQLPNRRLYGGKELQDETLAGNALDWYDFKARMYDPLIGRFMTTDAKEEKYYNISPYAYCLNNPMVIIDPTGDTVRYEGNAQAVVESLINKRDTNHKKNKNYSKTFKYYWDILNKSDKVYTFILNNDLPLDKNGVVRKSESKNGYDIVFSQDKGTRVTSEFGGFSPKYAALFEETYHAVDINNGKFIIDNQTAMDEARAWQFAATAPGTIEFIKTSDGYEGYTAAYTVKTMSTGWVAKMLKEGQPNPTFQNYYPESYKGEIKKYRGEVINRAYPSLNEGVGYGLSYHENNSCFLNALSCRLIYDTLSVPPRNLKYDRKGLIHYKSKKIPYTGKVNGNIVSPYGKNKVKNKDFLFYENFGSYEILAENAAFYEDMFRIAFGHHIFVRGTIKEGKETGQWQYRYNYKDTDFLFMTANYKNGKLEGTADFYKPDGRLYQEAEFVEGKLVLRIWYNEDGEIIYKDYYEDDRLIRTEQYAKDPRSF